MVIERTRVRRLIFSWASFQVSVSLPAIPCRRGTTRKGQQTLSERVERHPEASEKPAAPLKQTNERRPAQNALFTSRRQTDQARRTHHAIFVFGDALAAVIPAALRAPRDRFPHRMVETALMGKGPVPSHTSFCSGVTSSKGMASVEHLRPGTCAPPSVREVLPPTGLSPLGCRGPRRTGPSNLASHIQSALNVPVSMTVFVSWIIP